MRMYYFITKTVKYEIEKQEGRFLHGLLAHLAASLVKRGNYSVVKGGSGRGVEENIWIIFEIFRSTPSFKQYGDY